MTDFFNGLWSVVSDLPWPVVVLLLALLLLFRRDFPALMHRVKRVKVPGVELEFYEDLTKLPEKAEKAAEEIASSAASHSLLEAATGGGTPEVSPAGKRQHILGPLRAGITIGGTANLLVGEAARALQPDKTGSVVDSILEQAASDPKVALIHLSSEIEGELRQLLGGLGFLEGRSYIPFRRAVETLHKEYSPLPPSVLDAVETFWRVRNHIIHGGEGSRDDVLRALDSGLVVYKTLRAIPHATFVVYHPGTTVYADAEGEDERPDVKAVIIEEVSWGGAMRHKHVLPTTRTHFREGFSVAWEFSEDTEWGESWYRDPDTDEIKYAWTNALEFIGRDMRELRRAG